MNKYTNIEPRQSLFDLSLQEYGSVEGLFSLMEDNNINSVNHNFASGDIVAIKQKAINQDVVDYYEKHKTTVNGGFTPVLVSVIAPTITAITYTPLVTSQTKNIVITGTNYIAGTTVSISKAGNVITVNSVTIDSLTQLTVNITAGTITGGFDVTVNNGLSVTEIDGIAITQAAPTITAIAYTPLVTSQTKNIVITGTNYIVGTTVSISKAGNVIAVNSVTIDSLTQLTVNITAGTITGGFDVTVNNGLSVTEIDGIAVGSSTTVLTPGDGTTIWNLIGSIIGGLGSLTPNGTGLAWSRGGSFPGIPVSVDFTVSMTPENPTNGSGYIIAGISYSDSSANYPEIKYGFYLEHASPTDFNLYKMESGNYSLIGVYAFGDVLEVKRISGVISYWKNGVRLSLSVTDNSSFVFDSSFYSNNNIKLAAITATI